MKRKTKTPHGPKAIERLIVDWLIVAINAGLLFHLALAFFIWTGLNKALNTILGNGFWGKHCKTACLKVANCKALQCILVEQMGENERFAMIKARHRTTFETALKQGKMDSQMVKLCEFTAETKNFFTSSCCSGRIVLLEKRGNRKIDTFFHRKWHRKIKIEELLEGFKESTKGELWLKVDPFILHLGCVDLEHAKKVLEAMKKAGVKRGGIIVAEPGKFLIEFQGTESMSIPLREKKKKLAGEDYIRALLPRANKLLKRNYARLEKLETELRNVLD